MLKYTASFFVLRFLGCVRNENELVVLCVFWQGGAGFLLVE